MHPALFAMYSYVQGFCYSNDIEMVVTSIHRTKEQDAMLGAKSSTHQEFRAFDLSLKSEHGWTYKKVERMREEIEDEFRNVGAISAASGESRPVYIHLNHNDPNFGTHAHFQIRRGI